VALTRVPENEGENQDISLETTFTLSLADHTDMFFSVFFVCSLWFLLNVRVNVVSCRITLSSLTVYGNCYLALMLVYFG